MKVMIGVPTGGMQDVEFVKSLMQLKAYDEKIGGHYLDHGGWCAMRVGTSVTVGRNLLVKQFLKSDCDWLLQVDDDQTFPPDLVDQLVKSADEVDRPIISGLVVAYRPERPQGLQVAPAFVVMGEDGLLRQPLNIPAANPVEVAAVGAGCLFVHRTVFEKMLTERPDSAFPWFENETWKRLADGEEIVDSMGEDYVFSLRAGACGFPILVDTDIVCGHRKLYEFTPSDFWGQVQFEDIEPRCYVVIPAKDKVELTESLVKQLVAQGAHHQILIIDNGSNHKTLRRYKQLPVEVLPAPDAGIHEMWNMGAQYALSRWPKVDIAFLNNDLNIGLDFLQTLSADLRAEPLRVAVSPNYDGRQLDGITEQSSICANRYDGTGGAPGFAFMVKGEFFAGYRFPDECKWWFGDNDFLMSVLANGGTWDITPNATVEHLEGGGQTGDWDAYQKSPQHDADRQAFLARWT